MDYRIDESSFENAAKAVWCLNESVREKFTDWHELLETMFTHCSIYIVQQEGDRFSTSGYTINAHVFPGNDYRSIEASVTAYTAARFFERPLLTQL